MYASLMGTFDIPALINYQGSTSVGKSIMTVFDRTDPQVLPSHYEPQVPLSTVEVAYRAIVNSTIDSIMTPSTVSEDSDESYLPTWVEKSLYSCEFLDMVFALDEAILKAMSGKDKICEYLHHRSFFLPDLNKIENQEF